MSVKSPSGIFYCSNYLNLMDKKTIVSILIIFAGVTALVLWSKSIDSGATNKEESVNYHLARTANALNVPETLYDFGTISMKDGKVTKVFKVTNTSDQDINFPSLTTSCMCTSAYFVGEDGSKKGPFGMPGMGYVPKLNAVIKAGQSADVEVVYDTNAHGPAGVGMVDRFIYLEGDGGNKLQFEIKANVTP